jgi:hypothetical protein
MAQHVGKPRDPSSTEYLYVTVWENVESIQAFAGERWEEAVITPDEEHLLKDTGSDTTTPFGQTEKCSPKVRTSVSDTGLPNACSEWTGMRAAAAGVPGMNRYREPRVWWRHGSHDPVARLEVQVGARLTTFEPTANADENVGRNVALVHRWH